MLTEEQVKDYQREGQINSPIILDSKTISNLKSKMEFYFSKHPEFDQDYSHDVFKYDRSWLEVASRSDFLDIAAQLIGDDIICWGSAFFAKKGIGGKATPWHQDGQYWPIEPLATCTIWIAIDEATEENGCLKVIPGSHRDKKHFSHLRDDRDDIVLNQEIDPAEMPCDQPRNVVLKPGMFSFHDAYIIHGADANNSGKQRAGLTFRYMPATSHFNREKAKKMVEELGVVDISDRELLLMRGVDKSGQNDVIQI